MLNRWLDWFCDVLMPPLLFTMVGSVILAVVAATAYVVYDGFVAETFSLRKDRWTCTASHEETYTYFTQVGKVSAPQTGIQTVCDEYRRR
jgi:hypothetical protein